MRHPVLLTLGLLACLQVGSSQSVAADGWKAGLARVRITPRNGMPMAGYASRGADHAERTLNELWAKALVLEDAAGHRAALITYDLIGIDRELSQAITSDILKQQGWQRNQVALATSHTHCGPVVNENLVSMHYFVFGKEDQQRVKDYARFLHSASVKLVDDAVASLQPAELTWGSGTATFAVNRRNNPADQVPDLRAAGKLKGPFDHDVPVLTIKQDGKLTGIVFGYACHCTTLSSLVWSGDYAGFAQQNLEERFPEAQAMFWAGCGGDQNPLPRRTEELVLEYGRRLADAVQAVVEQPREPITPQLQTRYEEIPLPFGPLPSREQLEEDTAASNPYVASRAKYLLQQIDSGEPLSQTYPYPIEVWKLGQKVVFVILGGEVTVDYALRLKNELSTNEQPETGIWCAGYSNDVMAYIPSRRVLLEGGYEGGGAMVYYGQPTVWAPEVEDLIVSKAEELAK